MGLLKDLQGLNAAYAEVVSKEAYTVTAADKKGNTPAYQGYKAGKKNVKTGKPLYKAADHLKKEDRESKLWDEVAKMLSELHELRGVQYKVVPLNEHHQKDADGNIIPHEEIEEAATTRIPAQNGNVYELMYSWRGKSYFCKMFFPQPGKPSKDEVQAALTKVYPSAILRNCYISSVNYGDPYIHAGAGDGFTDK